MIKNEPLTGQDVKALRLADSSICFDLVKGTIDDWGDGEGRIRCHKNNKVKKNDPYTSTDTLEYTIHCASHIHIYHDGEDKTDISAYEYCGVYRYSNCPSPLVTWIDFLKVGDRVSLEWYRGNNNPDDGYHNYHDYLQVNVYRVVGSKVKTYAFQISSGSYKSNTARMTRNSSERWG